MRYRKLRELYGVPSDVTFVDLDVYTSSNVYVCTDLMPDSSYGTLLVFSGNDAGPICSAVQPGFSSQYYGNGFMVYVAGSNVYRRSYFYTSSGSISSSRAWCGPLYMGSETLCDINFRGEGRCFTTTASTFSIKTAPSYSGTNRLTDSTGCPIYLFRSVYDTVSYGKYVNIGMAAFSRGSSVVGVMVPAYRGSSYGMYDLVRSRFIRFNSLGSYSCISIDDSDNVPEYLLYALGYEETSSPSIPCDLRPLG